MSSKSRVGGCDSTLKLRLKYNNDAYVYHCIHTTGHDGLHESFDGIQWNHAATVPSEVQKSHKNCKKCGQSFGVIRHELTSEQISKYCQPWGTCTTHESWCNDRSHSGPCTTSLRLNTLDELRTKISVALGKLQINDSNSKITNTAFDALHELERRYKSFADNISSYQLREENSKVYVAELTEKAFGKGTVPHFVTNIINRLEGRIELNGNNFRTGGTYNLDAGFNSETNRNNLVRKNAYEVAILDIKEIFTKEYK